MQSRRASGANVAVALGYDVRGKLVVKICTAGAVLTAFPRWRVGTRYFDKDRAYNTVIVDDNEFNNASGISPGVTTTKYNEDFDMKETAWSIRAQLVYRFDF
jgi:hypothetical protein